MPQRMTADDILPWADARQRRVDQDKLADPLRMLSGESVADHVADVVGDEVDMADLQRVEDSGDVLALSLFVVTAGRPLGEDCAAKIWPDQVGIGLEYG